MNSGAGTHSSAVRLASVGTSTCASQTIQLRSTTVNNRPVQCSASACMLKTKMARKVTSMGFLGSGQMARALVKGFVGSNFISPENIITSATSERSLSLQKMKADPSCAKVNVTSNNSEVVKNSEVVWIATKPHAIPRVLHEIAPIAQSHQLFISVAAGTTIKTMENCLPEASKVVRTMPNTPVIIQKGVTIYALGKNITDEDHTYAKDILEAVGVTMEMQEHSMDIMTALSGGGPSFMYLMMDALADGGVYAGVPKDVALKLTAYTMIGSAEMVLRNGIHPQELKDSVCSPAGTAIQGIRLLERKGFRGTMMDAVHAASRRALELSKIQNGEEKDIYVKR